MTPTSAPGRFSALVSYHTAVVGALQTNTASTVEFWTSLLGAKTMSEALTINAGFTRRQLQAFAAQSTELSALMGQVAVEVTASARTIFQPR